MRLIPTLLVGSSLAMLAVGATWPQGSKVSEVKPAPTGPTDEQVVAKVEGLLQKRFLDITQNRFGIRRIPDIRDYHGPVYPERQATMAAETLEEQAVLDEVTKKGWQLAIFTSPSQYSSSTFSKDRPYNGPVFYAGRGPVSDDFPAPWGRERDPEVALIARRTAEGEEGPFEYKGWTFHASEVKAVESCLKCHPLEASPQK